MNPSTRVRSRRRPVARVASTTALLLFAVAALAGCGSSAATPTAAPPTAAPSTAPSATATGSEAPATSDGSSDAVPDSPVAGIVTDVTSAGLDQVTGFTLRTNDGESIQFTIGTLENGDEFPPGHLKEHQAAASPVLVFFRPVNGQLVVYRIEDAG